MPGNTDLKIEAKRLTAAERRPQVVALRRQGLSTREIAARFDVSHTTIEKDLHTAYATFAEQEATETDLLRTLEGLRLDRLQLAVWPRAIHGDIDAVRTVVMISQRRCALFSLNKPINLMLLVQDELEAILQRLEARLDEETLKRVLEALIP